MCPISGYFDTPFASSGSVTPVPDPIQGSGSVSYTQGYGSLYSTPVASGGLDFPRTSHNQILLDITSAIQFQQQNTVAPFITSTMNGGSPYSYPANAVVLKSGVIYQSLVGSNADTPPSVKWAVVAPFFTINPAPKTGTSYTYLYSDAGALYLRSNSGSIMSDTLPGTGGSGVLPAGESITIGNNDASALMTVKAGSGATVNGSSGFVYISPGHRITFVSDGANYWTQTQQGRLRLKANTNLYVATTGNDTTNAGIASAAPWLTIQNAVNFVANMIDLNGFNATINVADGTYAAGVSLGAPLTGGGTLSIVGNITTPANCIVSVTNSECFLASNGGNIQVAGFQMATASSGSCLQAVNGGQITVNGAMNCGACAANHLFASDGGIIEITSNYTISGSASAHYTGTRKGEIFVPSSITVTVSGTPAFSTAFAVALSLSDLELAGITFTGSATGSRYNSINNSLINTNGGGATYLPGNSGGTTGTGGLYV